MNQTLIDLLKEKFGYNTLRSSQEPIIKSVLQGQDTVGIMPTGGGKSLCYQLPALYLEGLTVVISPLIALMHDQVESLKENGIWAEYLNSSLDDVQKKLVFEALQTHNEYNHEEDKLQIFYTSPERLFANDNSLLNYLKTLNISLFAIDEAHCISNWGHDFRPEYANLGVIKDEFENIPVIALTATADELTRKDIIEKLHLKTPYIHISSFDRANITYTIESRKDGFKQLFNYITSKKNQSGIIYCLSRKSTEELAQRLVNNNIKAIAYHARLPNEDKNQAYDMFMKDEVQIVVATIAFGMGIDKPNVRFVVHWNLPKSIENYYQETGRAGRDGLPSEAYMLYNVSDVFTLKKFIDSGQEDNPYINKQEVESFRKIQHDKLNRLIEFCKTGHCRRRVLLQYFNEKLPKDCGNCDCCLYPKQKIDGTIIAQKIISTVFKLNQKYGVNYIADIIVGSKEARIINNQHNHLSTYGIGSDQKKEYWLYFINQLVDLGYLTFVYDGYIKTIILDQKSIDFIKNQTNLELINYEDPKPQKPTKTKVSSKDSLNEFQNNLFERLRLLRKELAVEQNVAPFIIFSDASLVDMVTKLPKNNAEFSMILGVGETKLNKYGAQFIDLIINYECSQSE
ncbi:MAG: DNA helicase RecQ [Patescibacteria group bacterium]